MSEKLREITGKEAVEHLNNLNEWFGNGKVFELVDEDIPKHETVEQWESRTGEKYPDDGPVYFKMVEGDEFNLTDYGWSKIFKLKEITVIVANHHGKPEIEG